MTRRRKIVWLSTPLLLVTAALVSVAALHKRESQFSFLSALHPKLLPADIRTGGSAPRWKFKRGFRQVMIFSETQGAELRSLIDKRFASATHQMSSLVAVVHLPGEPAASTVEMSECYWNDPSGLQVYLLTGPMASNMAKNLTRSLVPAGSCVVVTTQPQSWFEEKMDAVKTYLHLN